MSTATTTPQPAPSAAEPLAENTATSSWFKGIGTEWAKITWPTQMQLVSYVIVVLLMTGAMTLFVWLADTLFRWGIHLITPDKFGH